MTIDIEARLKRAYLANGGSEQVFESIKSDLISDYRRQATITDALAEANRPVSMNDLMRMEFQNAESRNDDLLLRFARRGNTNNAA